MTTHTQIDGVHHITAIASDPQRNLDFYTKVLGQRLVKKTVNFDDPKTYHFYFADYRGTPGTVLTFFPWDAQIRRGRRGVGEIAATAYSIPASSIHFWQTRFAEFRVPTGEIQTRFGQSVLPFQDPDGMLLELIAEEDAPAIEAWKSGPIPAEHELRGFHSATLWCNDEHRSQSLLTETFGYQQLLRQGNRIRLQGKKGSLGSMLDLLVLPDQSYGALGAGSVHHIAFRVENDEVQDQWREKLLQQGYRVTPMQDRQYFHSIYFREPSGVLYELATNPPGFDLDESLENLGATLKLPTQYEVHRNAIEENLPKLELL